MKKLLTITAAALMAISASAQSEAGSFTLKPNVGFTYTTATGDLGEDTDGAFDITVAPLVNAWGFGFKNGTRPDQHQVDSLLQIVGYKKVSLRDGKIIKEDPRIMLDCSAIAKGFGTQTVAEYLRHRGVKNYMVEIGGEIVTSGVNNSRLPWKIGVTKPVDDSLSVSQEMQTVLNVT